MMAGPAVPAGTACKQPHSLPMSISCHYRTCMVKSCLAPPVCLQEPFVITLDPENFQHHMFILGMTTCYFDHSRLHLLYPIHQPVNSRGVINIRPHNPAPCYTRGKLYTSRPLLRRYQKLRHAVTAQISMASCLCPCQAELTDLLVIPIIEYK